MKTKRVPNTLAEIFRLATALLLIAPGYAFGMAQGKPIEAQSKKVVVQSHKGVVPFTVTKNPTGPTLVELIGRTQKAASEGTAPASQSCEGQSFWSKAKAKVAQAKQKASAAATEAKVRLGKAFSAVIDWLKHPFGRHEPLVQWDECVGNFPANYNEKPSNPTKCKKRMLSADLANKLDNNLPQCVQKAASIALGVSGPQVFNLGHMGVSPDANHKQRSLHSLGRAIDLNYIRFKSGGRNYDLRYLDASAAMKLAKRNGTDPMTDPTFRFFKEVENCWNTSGPPFGGSVNCSDNSAHHDHLHLSVPVPNDDGTFMSR